MIISDVKRLLAVLWGNVATFEFVGCQVLCVLILAANGGLHPFLVCGFVRLISFSGLLNV